MAKTPTLNEILDQWYAKKQALDLLVTEERELRTKAFAMAFPNPVEGTNKTKLDHGMALVADYKMNYNIDRPVLEATLADLAPDANERALIESVISYTPKVREGEFKKLDDDAKKVVGPFITQKPGLPSMEIKPQSKVRW